MPAQTESLSKAVKAVVAGHICLDITPVFPGRKIGRVEELLAPGRLVYMDGVDVHPGGAVANTGLALRFLGVDARLMGKVGRDTFGDIVLKILGEHHAAENMIVSGDSGTSYSVVLAPKGIDRIFLHDPGCNDTFCAADVDFDVLRSAALFHFGYPPVMKRMYERGGAELVSLFRTVKEIGVATSLDMAAVDPDSEAGGQDWAVLLEAVLPYVDFFVPSFGELCYMLDRAKFWRLTERAEGGDITAVASVEDDVAPLGRRLVEMGAKVVLIKCGAPGIYYRAAGRETLRGIGAAAGTGFGNWAGQEGFEASYKAYRVASGTGAGDTCIAAFLAAVLRGYPLLQCVRLASAEGTSCLAGYDALSGLLPLEELEKKIEAGWPREDFR